MFSALVKLHSRDGIAVQINSMVDDALNQKLEEVWNGGKKTKHRRPNGPNAQELFADHNMSQVDTVAYSPVKHDDDYQFDPADEHLMTRGKILTGNREIETTDKMLDTLAMHIYESVIVLAKSGPTQRLMKESKGKHGGSAKAQSIMWLFKRVYFTMLCCRLFSACFQVMLLRKMEALLPLIFKKVTTTKVEQVMAYIDSRYIDPDKHEAHLMERSQELMQDLLGMQLPNA